MIDGVVNIAFFFIYIYSHDDYNETLHLEDIYAF